MRRVLTTIIVATTSVILATGCATSRPHAPDSRMARHPFDESRMSSQPAAGYTPSGVFRIRGSRNTLYLAGTCHVVADDQIPFPSPFYAAYRNVDEIYVEMDTTNPSFLASMRLIFRTLKWYKAHAKELTCPKGRTLSDYVSAETLERLRAMHGKDYSNKRLTPISLMLMHEGGALENEEAKGVDDTFLLKAHQDGKRIRELDDGTITDTLFLFLDTMLTEWRRDIAERGADAVIEEELLNETEEEHRGWRQGDMKVVESEQTEMKEKALVIYETGVVERNRKWMSKLEKALRQKKDLMVLVGVDHLGGKDGLLHLLAEAGFTVEQMYGVDRPAPAAPQGLQARPESHRARPGQRGSVLYR